MMYVLISRTQPESRDRWSLIVMLIGMDTYLFLGLDRNRLSFAVATQQ